MLNKVTLCPLFPIFMFGSKITEQKMRAVFTKQFVGNHLQLILIQTTFGRREKLPAQHLPKLCPCGCRTVGEEHDVLETHFKVKKKKNLILIPSGIMKKIKTVKLY